MRTRGWVALGLVATTFAACTLDFDQYRNPDSGLGGTPATGGAGGLASGGDGGGGQGGGNAGGGGAANDCPVANPDGMSCTDTTLTCVYGETEHCECWLGEWDCDTCPASEPADNSSCNSSFARCFYDPTQCFCRNGNWTCGECPASEPANNSGCNGLRGLHCAYGATGCSCSGMSGNWECVTP